jgi:hypothetical protein
MTVYVKTIWTTAVIVVFLSFIWFLLGTTACFNRGIDLVTTVIYMYVGFPSLLFIVISIISLKKRWMPNNIGVQIVLVIIIPLISLFFARILITSVDTKGWLTESVSSDYTQTTLDEKYEYTLQLINVFQKNSYAQLYLKEKSTKKVIIIPVEIQMNDIGAINVPDEDDTDEDVLKWRWSELTLSDVASTYILTTTKELNRKVEKFEINIEEKTAKMIAKKESMY